MQADAEQRYDGNHERYALAIADVRIVRLRSVSTSTTDVHRWLFPTLKFMVSVNEPPHLHSKYGEWETLQE